MTGPREAGVLLGQSRARDARRKSTRDDGVIALERIADSLEGIEVSLAVLADIIEMQVYVADEGDYGEEVHADG